MGGEKSCIASRVQRHLGSPPRGRGKDSVCNESAPLVGITPAWAGKSRKRCRTLPRGRDHPRVGGEKLLTTLRTWSPSGSPPRGRGKAFIRMGAGLAAGITPAWAGKSRPRAAHPAPGRDHPRVGGEKSISAPSWGPGIGSPPRGRGKDLLLLLSKAVLRITPAWAGKSNKRKSAETEPGDHPRVGGEKFIQREN